MESLLLWIGRLAGLVGTVVCIVAAAARLGSLYWLGGFQVGTLLQAGMASMVLGCLCFLADRALEGRTMRHWHRSVSR